MLVQIPKLYLGYEGTAGTGQIRVGYRDVANNKARVVDSGGAVIEATSPHSGAADNICTYRLDENTLQCFTNNVAGVAQVNGGFDGTGDFSILPFTVGSFGDCRR